MIAALVLLGTGVAAQAQQKAASGGASFSSTPTSQPQDPMSPAGVRKTLQWDNKTGRWGLSLDGELTASRESKVKEAELGAYYRVTPSLRVGGALGVINTPNPKTPVDSDPNQARMRVVTALKF